MARSSMKDVPFLLLKEIFVKNIDQKQILEYTLINN
jgi:hypothetical protein